MFYRVLLVLIAFQVVYGKECLIDEIHPECYKHCYNSVKPVLSYIPLMQKQLDTCENRNPPYAHDSLEKMINQLDQQLSLTELWQTRLDECQSVQDKLTKFLEDYNQNLAPIQFKLMDMEEQFKKQVEKVEICEANAKVTKSILDNQQSLFKKCQKKIKMWRKIGTKYYYIENNESQNWSGALQRCTELGGHLASLQSEEEWNNLRKELGGHSYWLDVNDIEEEGVFKSATTGQLANFLNWHNGEPSNYSLFTNALENCVELRYNHNFFFNDRNCENPISFICETESEHIDTME